MSHGDPVHISVHIENNFLDVLQSNRQRDPSVYHSNQAVRFFIYFFLLGDNAF